MFSTSTHLKLPIGVRGVWGERTKTLWGLQWGNGDSLTPFGVMIGVVPPVLKLKRSFTYAKAVMWTPLWVR